MITKTQRILIIAAVCAVVGAFGVAVFLIYQPSTRILFTSPLSVFQAATSTPQATTIPSLVPQLTYIEVVESCGPDYVGDCVKMRSGPGLEHGVVAQLRTGVVLLVDDAAVTSTVGTKWYKIKFASALQYPERVRGSYYVSADVVQVFSDPGDQFLTKKSASTTKRIVVDVSEQMLYAYDGNVLFMEVPISTGLEFTPTPRGVFPVFKKTPARYMQGPIPGVSEQVYDLPGVPWDLYFTKDGAVIHGAYWHDSFGQPWSHGCVNLSPQNAKKLYMWAEVGMLVTVQN